MAPEQPEYPVGTPLPKDGTATGGECIACARRFSRTYYVADSGPYCGECFGRTLSCR